MKMKFINLSTTITKQQKYKLKKWMWKYKMSRSEIVRKLLSYYIENPGKLKEILKK